jgi:arginyl-tRNA synthetase
LATLADRVAKMGAERILYVVDQRQARHFEQVFRATRKAGLSGVAELRHVGFGTVNGPDRKPYKTRQGGVARLSDLLDEAVARAALLPRADTAPALTTRRRPIWRASLGSPQ